MRIIYENNHDPAVGKYKEAYVEDANNDTYYVYDNQGTYFAVSSVGHVGTFPEEPTDVNEGQVYFNTVTGKLYVYHDGDWVQIGLISWGSIVGTLASQADLQAALDAKASAATVSSHIANTSNPHAVTKTQVGLGNADNTSDANKPVSTAQQTALNLKADDTAVLHKAGKETITGEKTFPVEGFRMVDANGAYWLITVDVSGHLVSTPEDYDTSDFWPSYDSLPGTYGTTQTIGSQGV